MKKIRLKFLYLCAVLMMGAGLLTSCDDSPQHIESTPGGGMNVKDEIVFDGNTTHTLSIRASEKPVLTCEAQWLKIGEVKNLSTGIYTTELTAEVNATGERRFATIYVKAGKETTTINVVQYYSDVVEIKSIDPDGVLDPDGGELTLRYVATGTPATNLPDWISVTGTRALVEGTLAMTYLPNNTGKEREGVIVLAVGKGAVANVTVRQPSR